MWWAEFQHEAAKLARNYGLSSVETSLNGAKHLAHHQAHHQGPRASLVVQLVEEELLALVTQKYMGSATAGQTVMLARTMSP